MFRKPFEDYNFRGSAPLQAFDRKRLQNLIAEEFSVTPRVAELLVPEGLFSVRFETHERILGTAYVTLGRVPLWFTLGKGVDDLVPTVYTLWKHRNLLPILSIPGPAVPAMLHGPFLSNSDKKIKFQPSASISTGKLVCITRECELAAGGIPLFGPAMAVGRMLLPSHAVEGGKKGKAVTLLHAWKDQLWVMGGEGRPPRPRLLIAGPDEEEDVDEVWESEEIEADAESQPESSSDRDTPKELSPEEVSHALRSALLKSIFVALSKLPPGSFPITASVLYETYILPYRSSQLTKTTKTPVDIKHSGSKTLTLFLKARAKEGLIKVKESKGGMVITGVDESHPSVRAHVREATAKDAKVRKEEPVQPREIEEDEAQRRERQVTRLRKPGPVSAALFQHVGKDPEELFTKDKIRTIIKEYLTSKHLFKSHDPDFVNVAKDRLLLDIVSNGKESVRIELLERKFMDTKAVIEKVVGSTEAWYKITIGDRRPVIREGKPRPVSINVVCSEDHVVTYVSGFEVFRLDADSLAEGLKTACAASTTVQPDSQDPDLKQVMVQGEQAKAVKKCLIARGMQKQWIEVTGAELEKNKKKRTSA